MKITGQISLIGIAIVFALIELLFFNEPKNVQLVDFLIAVCIAWFVGRQYDKAKFYAEKLKMNEENYKNLIDMLPDCIVIHDQGTVLYINKAGEHIIGTQTKDDILGKSIYEFIHPSYLDIAKKHLGQLLEQNKTTDHVEQKLIRQDGNEIFVEVSSRLIHYKEKEAILSMLSNITDKKEQADNLLQNSEKLSMLGQLAAGIAHEVRNPLTSIKGFIQLFRSKYPSEEAYFDLVLSELDRINLIVGEFLILGKPTAVDIREVDIKNLINDVVTLIETQSNLYNVQILLELDEEIPKVMCEANQLKQVFINILKNAIEAMPRGGKIEVKVKVEEKNKVSLYFIDEGIGIPKERIPALGEPFNTTKKQGSGLGLMTSYKIIENHKGEIKISSEENKGTTIEVILPTVS